MNKYTVSIELRCGCEFDIDVYTPDINPLQAARDAIAQLIREGHAKIGPADVVSIAVEEGYSGLVRLSIGYRNHNLARGSGKGR